MDHEGEHLYEIVFSTKDHRREGFSVWMKPEEIKKVVVRFKFGETSGIVKDWAVLDVTEDGISYEEATAIVQAGGWAKGKFRSPAITQTPYLVVIEYKPTFFGLKSGENIGFDVWMTRFQAESLRELLSNDRRVGSFNIMDVSSNIETERFEELLKERGVGYFFK